MSSFLSECSLEVDHAPECDSPQAEGIGFEHYRLKMVTEDLSPSREESRVISPIPPSQQAGQGRILREYQIEDVEVSLFGQKRAEMPEDTIRFGIRYMVKEAVDQDEIEGLRFQLEGRDVGGDEFPAMAPLR